jgi:hypothetical protein
MPTAGVRRAGQDREAPERSAVLRRPIAAVRRRDCRTSVSDPQEHAAVTDDTRTLDVAVAAALEACDVLRRDLDPPTDHAVAASTRAWPAADARAVRSGHRGPDSLVSVGHTVRTVATAVGKAEERRPANCGRAGGLRDLPDHRQEHTVSTEHGGPHHCQQELGIRSTNTVVTTDAGVPSPA